MAPAVPNSERMTAARIAGLLVAILALIDLAGWILAIPWMRRLLPGAVEMKANTAIGLLLASVALCLLDGRPSSARRRLGQAMALIVAALGAATACEWAFGWRLGIDELFIRVASDLSHGRMSSLSAAAFITIGLGLALLPFRRLHLVIWMFALLTIVIVGVPLVGYIWNSSELMSDRFFPPVAINTSVGFLLVGLGVILANRAAAGANPGASVLFSSIESRALLGFVGSLCILLLAGRQTYSASVHASESARWVAHTQQVRATLGNLLAATLAAETEQRNYLLSGQPEYVGDYKRSVNDTSRLESEMAQLVADNPAQLENLKRLRDAIAARKALLERVAATFEQSGLAAAQSVVRDGQGRRLMEDIRGRVAQMDAAEAELLTSRDAELSHERLKTLAFLLLTLAVAVTGFIALYGGIRRELAARALAEESLRRSEENLAVTLHSIGDAVLATDPQRRITRLNPVAEKLTGWTEADARGRVVDEVFRIINEETRRPNPIPVDKVLATGEIHGLANHTILIARDGTEHPIADSAAPIRDRAGRILGVVLVFRDVTLDRQAQREIELLNETLEQRVRDRTAELRASGEMIRSITDHTDDFVFIKDLEGRFVFANPALCRANGATLEQMRGRAASDLNPNRSEVERFAAEDRRVLVEGLTVSVEESRAIAAIGERRTLLTIKSPRRDADGNVIGIIGISHDITARKRAEEEIRALNAELEQRVLERTRQLEVSNRELEAFSYSVSHDLRAPLRHVQGYVELLQRAAGVQLSDTARRYLKTISDASHEMGRLIDDLLDFSRMGRVEIREAPVDLDEVVDVVIKGLELATKDRNISWKIEPLPRVMGDFSMIRQVFANLVGNAVKYSKSRDPAEIGIGCAGGEGDRIVIYVRDNGAGFDMAYANKLFGVFQRLHSSDEFEGTGIGLATVRRIIDRHGGRTWAEGKVDQGATFYITLRPAEGPSSS